jgi:hypothetical protein
MNGWIGVDLDGTLAKYDGWKGADHIGEPVPAVVERVKQKLAEGVPVKIFTARVYGVHGTDQARRIEAGQAWIAIEQWCQKHIGRALEVTCTKDFAMIELWDDRAKQVQLNTGIFLEDELEEARMVARERMERT